MAFQPAVDCAEAVIRFVLGGKECVNRLNFYSPGGYSQTDIDTLADRVDLQVGANWLPIIQDTVSYVQTDVRGLATQADLLGSSAVSADDGSATGSSLPANAAFVVTLGSGFTGRSSRGRVYMMPMGIVNTLTASVVTQTYADAAVDAVADLLDDILNNTGWIPVILSRQHNGSVLSAAFTYFITDIIARNNLMDSQRGRLPNNH